jgi:hypothetical protein
MKRLQKKRSRKSFRTGLLENKDSTEVLRRKLSQAERLLRTRKRLTAPKFLKELQDKEDSYYLNLRLFKSPSGRRFSEDIIRDPVLKAIRYCRERNRQTEFLKIIRTHSESDFVDSAIDPALAKAFKKLSKDPLQDGIEPYDSEHERRLTDEFLTAVKEGNIDRLEELVQLCRIESRAIKPPKGRKRNSRPWHYYVAYAARLFLEKGVLPDKKTVKKLAYAFRAENEFSHLKNPVFEWAAKTEQKLKELQALPEAKWRRIFKELGLLDLPTAPTHPAR